MNKALDTEIYATLILMATSPRRGEEDTITISRERYYKSCSKVLREYEAAGIELAADRLEATLDGDAIVNYVLRALRDYAKSIRKGKRFYVQGANE